MNKAKGTIIAANPEGAITLSLALYRDEIASSNFSTKGLLLIPYKDEASVLRFMSLI